VTLPFSHSVELGYTSFKRVGEINGRDQFFRIPPTTKQIGAKSLERVAVWRRVPIGCAGPRRYAESVDDL
jgi:hypothetical protein